jgi:endonuclease I
MVNPSSASSALLLAAAAAAALSSSSSSFAAAQSSSTTTTAATYDGCDVATYYSSLPTDATSWTLADVSKLLQDTHQKILPVQEEGSDDVYDALIDLFPGHGDNVDANETVQLAFRDVPMAIFPYANSQTWQRANLWPEERISATLLSAGAKTDIHANVPADSTVFASKGRMFYGECGLFEDPDLCVSLPETNLTYTDGKIWQSPEVNRGAHARSILYMATRYMKSSSSGSNSTSGLDLVDCPPFASIDEFGYLSILLEWHASYPVTDAEVARNTRACERWQGNRNPFVDYPDAVASVFGKPDTIKSGMRQYEACFVSGGANGSALETDSPTATPNACQSIQPGDIQIILTNGDDPTQIAFFTLDEIPAAVGQIYVTDRPWDGSQLLDNGEGVVSVRPM